MPLPVTKHESGILRLMDRNDAKILKYYSEVLKIITNFTFNSL